MCVSCKHVIGMWKCLCVTWPFSIVLLVAITTNLLEGGLYTELVTILTITLGVFSTNILYLFSSISRSLMCMNTSGVWGLVTLEMYTVNVSSVATMFCP